MEFNMKDKLTLLREENGLTQEAISKTIGVKRPTYAKYENGQAKNIPNNVIYKLAKAYKVSTDFFFSLDTERNVKSFKFSDVSKHVTGDEMKFVSAVRLVPEEKRDEVFELILKYTKDAQDEPET